jgi:hypothetical protein
MMTADTKAVLLADAMMFPACSSRRSPPGEIGGEIKTPRPHPLYTRNRLVRRVLTMPEEGLEPPTRGL